MNDGGYMAVSPRNPDVVFCVGNVYNAGYFLAISHTSDGGTTWEHDTLDSLASNAWAVAFAPSDPNRVYVGGDSNYSYAALLITTDLGATWTSSHDGLVGKVYCLLTDPHDGQLVYAGTNNGVFKSTDAGLTWNATALTVQTRSLVLDTAHTECLYAGTYGSGVYSSSDYGENWEEFNTGLTCNKVLSLALRNGPEPEIFAGTEGGSVFRTLPPTAIASPSGARRPVLGLAVSPNPCRTTVTIRFSAPFTGRSTLSLLDATGREVISIPHSSLVNRHSVDVSHLAPGAYFVRLVSGKQTSTARLIVLD
jgi:hypothetical protein